MATTILPWLTLAQDAPGNVGTSLLEIITDMRIADTSISPVKLVQVPVFEDARGFFMESYNASEFRRHGLDATFVQDNHSLSRKAGTVRGLHFQIPPHAQGKLVRVLRGAIYDVAVDLRVGSPSYGAYAGIRLCADTREQLYIPPGFAHGFCTLKDDTEVLYKVDDYYAPECEKGVFWKDPALGIDWPVDEETATLSDKDRAYPFLSDLPPYFTYRA